MSYNFSPHKKQKVISSGVLLGLFINFIERQKPVDRFVLRALFFLTLASIIMFTIGLSNKYSDPTPVVGGTLIEGVVGVPRFINPALAVTRADQDLVALVFSGLMKITPDGNLSPDIAESVTLSNDGTVYNIVVRSDVRFHDNTPLTARDVIFTIGLLQDADLKSPLRGNWSGILLEEISEYEFNIILNEPYSPFIENLTFGILPRHIWNEMPIEQIPFSQRNTDPIGSGPFRIKNITRNSSGFIQTYELEKFKDYHRDIMLNSIQIKFYASEDALVSALSSGEVTSSIYVPLHHIKNFENNSQFQVITEPLPRIFAVFFNQNRSIALRDSAARKALSAAIPRGEMVNDVLFGYGVPTDSPIPPKHHTLESLRPDDNNTSAENMLLEGGWRKNSDEKWEKRIDNQIHTLSITLRTTNNPVFEQTAQYLRQSWESIGVDVFLEQYEQSDLLQAVIRPRDFEAILFGLDMNRTVDLYPFWHSSQREDPGLNIAQYASISVDSLLSRARSINTSEEQSETIAKIIQEIKNDAPAVFLYAPTLTYVMRKGPEVASIKNISRPHERFANVENWHIANEDLWKIFR
jgi:peptide/nickel transport system substrate-binding protein